MRHFIITGIVCGCLLIGSFYPKLILHHHMQVVNENGKVVVWQEDNPADLPVEIQFRFLRFFR